MKKSILDKFFDETKMLNMQNIESFVDSFFDYIRRNSENYKLLCRSNDFLFAAKKLTSIASKKFLDLCYKDANITKKEYVKLEINVFIEGLLCEYVKYCRGFTKETPERLYEYTKYWIKNFKERVCV